MSIPFKSGDARVDRIRPEVLARFVASVMTDDERAAFYDLPRGCRIREGAKIISREGLTCGEFVWIGEGAVLDASGGLEIGEHTSIGLNVMVWSHTSSLANLTLDNGPGSPLIERKRTRIGKGCFVAGPTVIYPGITIGDKVVILPMTCVTKDIPSYSMVAGSPARVVRTIDEEYIRREVERVRASQPPH